MANLLPGHDVGVMVQFGDDHLVAGCQVLSAVGLRHEVDTLGGATHEDDLLARCGIDEALHLLAGLFIGIGGTGCQRVGAAVDIRIIVFIVIRYLVDHLDGLLRGGAVVEPYEVVAVHLLLQHGEVLLDLLRVQRVHLLVVQVLQLLRLRDADAEAIVDRADGRRLLGSVRRGRAKRNSVADIGQVAERVSSSKQCLKARFQFLQM